MFRSRLQNSLTHEAIEFHTLLGLAVSVFSLAPDLLFDCLQVLEYAKIPTVSQSSSYGSINLCVLQDACHELFCVFEDFYASGMQDTEVTKSLTQYNLLPIIINSWKIVTLYYHTTSQLIFPPIPPLFLLFLRKILATTKCGILLSKQ